MEIYRYTCTACGLVTRTESNGAYRACLCAAPYVVEREEEDGSLSPIGEAHD